jgi:hypothetical protein
VRARYQKCCRLRLRLESGQDTVQIPRSSRPDRKGFVFGGPGGGGDRRFPCSSSCSSSSRRIGGPPSSIWRPTGGPSSASLSCMFGRGSLSLCFVLVCLEVVLLDLARIHAWLEDWAGDLSL